MPTNKEVSVDDAGYWMAMAAGAFLGNFGIGFFHDKDGWWGSCIRGLLAAFFVLLFGIAHFYYLQC